MSPIRRDGVPRPRAHEVNGIALKYARRDKETTYPELAGRGGVVFAGEVGGRFSTETAQFLSDLAWAKTQGVSDLLRASPGGAPCLGAQLLVRSPPRCWMEVPRWVLTVPHRVWPK